MIDWGVTPSSLKKRKLTASRNSSFWKRHVKYVSCCSDHRYKFFLLKASCEICVSCCAFFLFFLLSFFWMGLTSTVKWWTLLKKVTQNRHLHTTDGLFMFRNVSKYFRNISETNIYRVTLVNTLMLKYCEESVFSLVLLFLYFILYIMHPSVPTFSCDEKQINFVQPDIKIYYYSWAGETLFQVIWPKKWSSNPK